MKINIVWISVERATLVPSLLMLSDFCIMSAFRYHQTKQDPHAGWISLGTAVTQMT